jgi:magnesium-transporting ATPase (P-type)
VPDDAPKVDEIPFDSDRKRLVTVHRTGKGLVLYVKGALEKVLPACRWVSDTPGSQALTSKHAQAFNDAQLAMAEKGLRVLAFAHRQLPDAYDSARLEEDLVLDALVGLEDPPRPEVPAAITRCHGAGIRVVMVTGDHPQTAVAIGREIGLFGADPLVITGDQVGRMSDVQMWAALEAPDVLFARVGADQKLRIVTTLQRHRAIVAATGDGVNDAPALRAADIGIAMGVTGTDVARQAADMVLIDDNFASIVSGIEEGRAVYDNIRKFLTYILTSNVPELVPYLASAFFKMPLALTILQILAVDLGTDIVPALGLGAEKAEPGVMERPPRSRDDGVLTPALLTRAYLFLGGFEALAAMAAFVFVLPRAGYIPATTACLGAIVAMQIVNVHLCRSTLESVFTSARRWNALIMAGIATEIVLMLVIAYTPVGNAVFSTAPIDARAWLFMVPFAAAMLAAEELRKWIVRASARGARAQRRAVAATRTDR